MNTGNLRFPSLIVAAVLVAATCQAVASNSFTVSNLKDSGLGSLRDAINKANAAHSPPTPVVQFSRNLCGTIYLYTGPLQISGDMVINGPGANNLTVNVNSYCSNNNSVFRINFGNVNISGLTITGGYSQGGGGGIYNAGALTLDNSMVISNSGGDGAGIFNAPGGTLDLTDSTVASNRGSGQGGGIYNAGTATIVNSTVSDNTALSGGGVYNVFGTTVTLTNATVAYNGNTGNSSNPCFGGYFGGYFNNNNNNSSSKGGGLYNEAQVSTNIGNTIVAKNSAAVGPDVFQADLNGNPGGLVAFSKGNNLIGQTNGSTGWIASDQTGTSASPRDPKLGPLTQNGGPTTTRALLSGSPAIDKGNNSLALDPDGSLLVYDERGAGFPRIQNNVVDVGAYEAKSSQCPETACQWKTCAVHLLCASLPTGHDYTDGKFRDAIDHINKGLNPCWWTDDNHLVGDGGAVFNEDEPAMADLTDPNIPEGLATIAQMAAQELTTATGLLATTMYNSALAGRPSNLQSAQQSLQAAQSSWGAPCVHQHGEAFKSSYYGIH